MAGTLAAYSARMHTLILGRRARPILAATVLAGLCACGGGGDDAAVEPAPAPPSTSGGTAVSTCSLPDFTNAVLTRVNEWRARGANCGPEGVFPATTALQWNDALGVAAEAHSRDMQRNNFFSHTGSNGGTVGTRVTAAGYGWSAVGENIAAGQRSVQEVVDGWVASPGHCANLMSPTFRHIAVACVPGTEQNTYRTYWTMNLARPR